MPPKAGKSDAKAAAEPKAKDALTFLSQRELKVLAECLLTVPGFPDVSPRCLLPQPVPKHPFVPVSSRNLRVETGWGIGPRASSPSHRCLHSST
jgi:hypothetical protein